ncbi:MAG: hypothetical protein A3B70_04415 [Deltaproteobacteria bacterium RIFCSPHIGHO2_02_FULL_40_11]|nr:MAG: hypothetical protein A3B70_04415 [Deltaproteobacteria bacterium RIFCSPHIGHO2_02_FULL_40_11]
MNKKIKISQHSLPNTLTNVNEDAIGIDETTGSFILCDGMGGPGFGTIASQMACDLFPQFSHSSSLETESTWPFSKKEGLSLEENYLRMLLLKLNTKVFERAKHDDKQGWMGTNCIALLTLPEKVILGSVGNCRAYMFQKDKLIQLTQDESLAEHKKWTPLKAQHNLSLNFLGKEAMIPVDKVVERTFKSLDLFVFLSSGVINSLSETKLATLIQKNLNNFNSLAKIIVEAAHATHPQFDHSALILKF